MSQIPTHLRKLEEDEGLAIFYSRHWGQGELDPYDVFQLCSIRRDDSPPQRIHDAVCRVPNRCLIFEGLELGAVYNLSHAIVRDEYPKGLNIINEFSKRPREILSRHFTTLDEPEPSLPDVYPQHFSTGDTAGSDDRAGGVSIVGQPGTGTSHCSSIVIFQSPDPHYRKIDLPPICALVSAAQSSDNDLGRRDESFIHFQRGGRVPGERAQQCSVS